MKIRDFFIKFKHFCFMFFTLVAFVTIIVVLRQRLVSDDAFKMTYPEVEFINEVGIDKDLAIIDIRDLIMPFLMEGKIANVDIDGLRDAIKNLMWIEDVAVIRDFPNVIKIVVKSKNIIAYLVEDDEYYPITDKGEKLDVSFDYQEGLLVFGDDAASNLPDLIKVFEKYPSVFKNLVGVQFVNSLRWNLILNDISDGLIVKLDYEFKDGIEKLYELDFNQGIISRNISEIDLRDIDKILIKQKG